MSYVRTPSREAVARQEAAAAGGRGESGGRIDNFEIKLRK